MNSPAGWKASIAQAKARRKIANTRNESTSTEVAYSNILGLGFAIQGQKGNPDLALSLVARSKTANLNRECTAPYSPWL